MRDRTNQALAPELLKLARLYGVETAYEDATKQRQEAAADSLLAVLAALGAPVADLSDVPAALRERRQTQWRRVVEPVAVAWDSGLASLTLRLPAKQARGAIDFRLQQEDGDERRWSDRLEDWPDEESAAIEGVRYCLKRVTVPTPTSFGYHRLTVEAAGWAHETLVLAAPTRAYSPRGNGWERTWGVFVPLYALHSAHSWGAGDYADLAALSEWVQGRGGGLVGTLPLMPGFFDEPYESSPYSPASRLFWNEFYLNIDCIPELAHTPTAQAIIASADFQKEVQELRSAPLVDYRRQMTLKRRVLEELARSLFASSSERRAALERYTAEHPYLHDYAAFRAVGDRLRKPWTEWPEPLREGAIGPGDYVEGAWRYHLYAQWLADEQLQGAADRAQNGGSGLYLDLPLGVHQHGYDVWRERQAFVQGVAGGCPPDPGFPRGQNWGFTPLHPEGVREQGYRYVRAFLEHQVRVAKVLRIDHMPSFHRVYWIPPGCDASQGAYVRYPAEELYALFCLESRRHRTILVGEDLGTVPPEVPLAMARHNFHRMYIVQYEVKPDPGGALPEPPPSSIASVNTHDMPAFAAYWDGRDIDERRELGLIGEEAASAEVATRDEIRRALAQFLRSQGLLSDVTTAEEVLKACLAHLRDGPARLVLINLEDLWQETHSQNVPSTGEEAPNWRRKARFSLEAFCQEEKIAAIVVEIARAFR